MDDETPDPLIIAISACETAAEALQEAAAYLKAEAERETHANWISQNLPSIVSNLEEAMRMLKPSPSGWVEHEEG